MHNLHDPNLYSTRYGTVLRCHCCDRIQVTFHGYVLLMDEAEFERFRAAVERAHDREQGAEEGSPWGIQADTDGGPVQVRLTEASLAALHDLLQGAWRMHGLDERLRAARTGLAERAPDVVRDYVPGAH
jgi:hypothetical protein